MSRGFLYLAALSSSRSLVVSPSVGLLWYVCEKATFRVSKGNKKLPYYETVVTVVKVVTVVTVVKVVTVVNVVKVVTVVTVVTKKIFFSSSSTL